MPLLLETPLVKILSSNSRFLKLFQKLNIVFVKDLLWHFPSRYEDFSRICKIAHLEPNRLVTIWGKIESTDLRRSWRRKMAIFEAIVNDGSGKIKAIWFNQPYLAHILQPGKFVNLAGKVSVSGNKLYLSHPTYEITSDKKQEMRHTGRLVPIYPETKGLTSRGIRFFVQLILKKLSPPPEWLPPEVLEENNFSDVKTTLQKIHFPQKIEEAELAKDRFAFENLFLLQLINFKQKLKLAEEKSPAIKTDIQNLKEIISELPFELTFSQKKALWEIIQDLAKPKPMNRLLQGDVGSGKTVIAALAALIVSKNEYQTAFMAPTEVLAQQHFTTLKKIFNGIKAVNQPPTALLTSSSAKIFYENDLEGEIRKSSLISKIKNGEVKIIIGTHSLIQKKVTFNKLGLVIVDEQHRFGVKQRAALVQRKKVINNNPSKICLIPHFLSMSATPIPRTLMLTIFGDLDISLITELPSGRKNIITKIVPPSQRENIYKFIRRQVKEGRQVFVICPRIEQQTPENQASNYLRGKLDKQTIAQQSAIELRTVKEEYEKLSRKVFPDLRVEMLHGKLKPNEKEKIMKKFAAGEIDILISTSVIEVGVDIPNATVMMIEGAERFGLAQLYQLRGRVGRGKHQSYCFLLTDSSSKSTQNRLKAIIEAKNGLELAEKDLKTRGPGEFLGEAQTGFPDVAMQALQNIKLVKASREAALRIIQKDPTLKNYPLLQKKLEEFKKEIHLE